LWFEYSRLFEMPTIVKEIALERFV